MHTVTGNTSVEPLNFLYTYEMDGISPAVLNQAISRSLKEQCDEKEIWTSKGGGLPPLLKGAARVREVTLGTGQQLSTSESPLSIGCCWRPALDKARNNGWEPDASKFENPSISWLITWKWRCVSQMDESGQLLF